MSRKTPQFTVLGSRSGKPFGRNLTKKQVAEYLALSPDTLAKWRWTGRGPSFLKIGRAVRYSERELNAWLEDQLVESTSAKQISHEGPNYRIK